MGEMERFKKKDIKKKDALAEYEVHREVNGLEPKMARPGMSSSLVLR